MLSTLLVPIGITATWLSLRVDSTPAYVDTVAPLAEDPELRDALAVEVANAAVRTIERRVPAALLPDSLDAVVLASAQAVVENDGFPEFWRKANATAHREFLAIVHERQGVVADGWVHIDVGPLLDDVFADFVERFPVDVSLPSQSVMVPVVPESRLEQARGAYQVLEGLAWWVPLLWVGLVAVAVVVARGVRGRLRAGAACALGVAIGGALVMLLTSPTTDAVVDQVESERQDLARLVVEVVVASLDSTALAAAVGGLVVGVVLFVSSLLLGRPPDAGHP
ncbi:hypothetical protein [Nocardioides bizhenqiangii]|uniref:hypothetical protein n=1 Tax=Nocardioides bizhenqiangii TaxID=3095076 RepID=UPI002ACBEE94|nr:hypothetical protein [Nocardioides sp. HM23]